MPLGWSSVVLGARRRRELRSRELALVGDTVSYLLILGAVWAIYTTTGTRKLYLVYIAVAQQLIKFMLLSNLLMTVKLFHIFLHELLHMNV